MYFAKVKNNITQYKKKNDTKTIFDNNLFAVAFQSYVKHAKKSLRLVKRIGNICLGYFWN